VPVTTIRYYERMGLMLPARRTPGGTREYSPRHLQQLIFIRKARDLGFSVELIRGLLDLADPSESSCREVRKIAAGHLSEIREKINELVRIEKVLAGAIEHCSEADFSSCPVLELLNESSPRRSAAD
jgi:MerR family mercuric resistance operon transcriptional regulator